MRKLLIGATLVFAFVPWIGAQQPASASKPTAQTAAPMLTIDSIMRGPKLVGNPPTAVRWSKDSSKAYFTWQKASDDRSATFVVGRDGTGLRQLTSDEARTLDVAPSGRLDRARRRILTAEGAMSSCTTSPRAPHSSPFPPTKRRRDGRATTQPCRSRATAPVRRLLDGGDVAFADDQHVASDVAPDSRLAAGARMRVRQEGRQGRARRRHRNK
jgi:hypothetical protein